MSELTSKPMRGWPFWSVQEAAPLHRVQVTLVTLIKQFLPHLDVSGPLPVISMNVSSLPFLCTPP